MATTIPSVSALIDALGGPAEFGRVCGREGRAAANFGVKAKSRRDGKGSIPVGYWPTVIAAAAARGIAIDEALLVHLHNMGD